MYQISKKKAQGGVFITNVRAQLDVGSQIFGQTIFDQTSSDIMFQVVRLNCVDIKNLSFSLNDTVYVHLGRVRGILFQKR
jgi:hypothetical protein